MQHTRTRISSSNTGATLDKIRQKLATEGSTYVPPEIKALIKPINRKVHEVSIPVWHSDMDVQQHSGHASYIKYCHDAGCVAVSRDLLKRFDSDLSFYRVKRIVCAYYGESASGDNIKVFLWEDEDPLFNKRLNFILENKGKEIFHCTFVYY